MRIQHFIIIRDIIVLYYWCCINVNRRFIYVDIVCKGMVSYGGILSSSSLSKLVMDVSYILNIPPSKQLPGLDVKIPYFILADERIPIKAKHSIY